MIFLRELNMKTIPLSNEAYRAAEFLAEEMTEWNLFFFFLCSHEFLDLSQTCFHAG